MLKEIINLLHLAIQLCANFTVNTRVNVSEYPGFESFRVNLMLPTTKKYTET
jgi:hypothetical protein